MIAFTVLLNSMVTFILPMGILLMQASPQSLSLAVVWLFFIIMGPGMASPVYKLTFLGGNTRDIDEGVKRIDRILGKKPVPEAEHPQVPTSYDVEFCHVSFSYENTEQGTRTEALRDVSFTAPQGEITALVGPSGSGKSTIANLIPRFWDVEQGEIRIGGVDIRQDSPLLGCGTGRDTHRRRGYPPDSHGEADGHGVFRIPGHVPVLRHAL